MRKRPIHASRRSEGPQADSEVFQQCARISMGVMAEASVGHLRIGLSRELNRREKDCGWNRYDIASISKGRSPGNPGLLVRRPQELDNGHQLAPLTVPDVQGNSV
jgi:hypothetical protein